MTKDKFKRMTLKDAVNSLPGPVNSYGWFRKQAKEKGTVSMGTVSVPAHKEKGIWYVDEERYNDAVRQHEVRVRHLKEVTADYEKGLLHGNDGDTICTTWGGYQLRGDFRFVWWDYERGRRKSYGTWYCNKCNRPAGTEHDKEECHLCRNWNGCGRDCTLSRVYCSNCDVFVDL